VYIVTTIFNNDQLKFKLSKKVGRKLVIMRVRTFSKCRKHINKYRREISKLIEFAISNLLASWLINVLYRYIC